MDESEIQRKRRDNEEMATRRRASLLGYSYLDTRQFETTIPLVPDLLKVEEIKNAFIVPLQKGNDQRPYQFMITSQTPQSKISDLRKQYGSGGQSVDFFLISGSAYQAFLIRYDPPKEIVYEKKFLIICSTKLIVWSHQIFTSKTYVIAFAFV